MERGKEIEKWKRKKEALTAGCGDDGGCIVETEVVVVVMMTIVSENKEEKKERKRRGKRQIKPWVSVVLVAW